MDAEDAELAGKVSVLLNGQPAIRILMIMSNVVAHAIAAMSGGSPNVAKGHVQVFADNVLRMAYGKLLYDTEKKDG